MERSRSTSNSATLRNASARKGRGPHSAANRLKARQSRMDPDPVQQAPERPWLDSELQLGLNLNPAGAPSPINKQQLAFGSSGQPLSFQLRAAFLNLEPLLPLPFIFLTRSSHLRPAPTPSAFGTNSVVQHCRRFDSSLEARPLTSTLPAVAPGNSQPAFSALLLLEALQVHRPIFKVSFCNFFPVS